MPRSLPWPLQPTNTRSALMLAAALQIVFPIGPSKTCTVVLGFRPSDTMSCSSRERAVDERPSSTLGHSVGILLSVIG